MQELESRPRSVSQLLVQMHLRQYRRQAVPAVVQDCGKVWHVDAYCNNRSACGIDIMAHLENYIE